MKKRPLIVTIFAVLSFVATLQYIGLMTLWVVDRSALVAYLHALTRGGSGPEKIHLAMGEFEPVYYAGMAVVMAFVGRGLFRLQNWTRIFMLVMIGLSMVGLLVTSGRALGSGSDGAIALWLVRLGLCVGGWSYLMSSKVRAAFGSGGTGGKTLVPDDPPGGDPIPHQEARSLCRPFRWFDCSERYNLAVVILALTVAVVMGTAMVGFLIQVSPASSGQPSAMAHLMDSIVWPLLAFFSLSAVAGVSGWTGFFFLKQDGWHRLQWTALLPLNYGGRNPFDTSRWKKAE